LLFFTAIIYNILADRALQDLDKNGRLRSLENWDEFIGETISESEMHVMKEFSRGIQGIKLIEILEMWRGAENTVQIRRTQNASRSFYIVQQSPRCCFKIIEKCFYTK